LYIEKVRKNQRRKEKLSKREIAAKIIVGKKTRKG